MTGPAWGAIVALSIFILSHIGITIWWASRVNTVLSIVERDLKEIVAELKSMRDSYLSKEAFAYRIAQSDKEHSALWRRLDEVAGLVTHPSA